MQILLSKNIVKYFFVGGFAAFINIVIFFLFAKLLGFNYIAVGALAFLVATFANYVLSVKHVFESGARFGKKQELFWVYFVSLIGLGIDTGVLVACVDGFSIELIASKIIAIGVVFFWNYFARKHFIFKTKL